MQLNVQGLPESGETMLSGTLCNCTISLLKAEAVSEAEGVPFKEIKCAILDKQLIMTKIVVNPSNGGNSKIKSTEVMLQSFSSTGKDANRPQDLALSDLFLR